MYDHDPFLNSKAVNHCRRTAFFLSIFLVIGIVAGVVGYKIGIESVIPKTESGVVETGKLDFDILYRVKAILEDKFLWDDRFDDEKMSYGAVMGMVASLEDYYTTYFSPEEAQDFLDFLMSELEGIGAELTIDEDGFLVVVSPLPGTPADKAGICPKDKILEIDGEVAESELFDAVKRIKGPAGTEVCLTILHDGENETEEICIIRAVIDVPAVEWEEKENGIYHVSLRIFDDSVFIELQEELEAIKKLDPKGIILDLRYNGGGFLDGAAKVVSLFVPAGKKVTRVESRNGKNTRNEYTRGKPVFHKFPLVVLVNEGSASASEIATAALKYYANATVVGETTFGKTTAQELIDLPDGSLLRVTMAKWMTPDGKTLDDGFKPDIEVEDDRETEEDEQLLKAIEILRGM